MYKLSNTDFVIRIEDRAYIPKDTRNVDYHEYLKWLNKGNTPLPIDPKSQEERILEEKTSKIKEEKNKATGDVVVKYLIEHTAEEIDTYVKGNISTLAEAKNVIAKLAIAVGVALRE